MALDTIVAFLVAITLAALGTAADGWPIPRVFDEFAYILAGETFAAGRLSNPAHPMPEFFETIHVLQTPTYTAKYFPGHGLFLAAGMVLGGGARLGQWLAFGFMGGALVWMLRGWTSRRTALAGGALAILLLADTNWASGFWGAAAAAGGSALIVGALPRMHRRPTVTAGLAMGLGVVVLALSRPFEGLVLSLVPAFAVLRWLVRGEGRWLDRVQSFALPAVAVIAAGGALLVSHNRATTGNPLRPAYVAYEAKAPGAPPFVWQEPVRPTHTLRPPERARLRIDMAAFTRLRERPLRELAMRFGMAARFYLPFSAMAALLLLAPFALGDPLRRQAALAVAAVAGATAISSYFLASYVGPALPPLVMLTVVGAASLAARGRALRRLVVALGGVVLVTGSWQLVQLDRDERESLEPNAWERNRDAIATRVGEEPGRHLVFVSYAEGYRAQHEFVQNGADRAGARVLWAHDLGHAQNARLLEYERGRSAWILRVEPGPRGNRTILQRYGEGAPLP